MLPITLSIIAWPLLHQYLLEYYLFYSVSYFTPEQVFLIRHCIYLFARLFACLFVLTWMLGIEPRTSFMKIRNTRSLDMLTGHTSKQQNNCAQKFLCFQLVCNLCTQVKEVHREGAPLSYLEAHTLEAVCLPSFLLYFTKLFLSICSY